MDKLTYSTRLRANITDLFRSVSRLWRFWREEMSDAWGWVAYGLFPLMPSFFCYVIITFLFNVVYFQLIYFHTCPSMCLFCSCLFVVYTCFILLIKMLDICLKKKKSRKAPTLTLKMASFHSWSRCTERARSTQTRCLRWAHFLHSSARPSSDGTPQPSAGHLPLSCSSRPARHHSSSCRACTVLHRALA